MNDRILEFGPDMFSSQNMLHEGIDIGMSTLDDPLVRSMSSVESKPLATSHSSIMTVRSPQKDQSFGRKPRRNLFRSPCLMSLAVFSIDKRFDCKLQPCLTRCLYFNNTLLLTALSS